MRKFLIVAAVAAAACGGLPAFAATDAECQAMWKKADTNNDGKLSEVEARRYVAMMRVNDYKLPADNNVDQTTFVQACKANVFVPVKVDSGAPLKGANSFTEGQARDRAVAQGFDNVKDLKKDSDGIWRGSATQDGGKQVEIAVDYRGNVVSKSR
jgi:hypothetical protein